MTRSLVLLVLATGLVLPAAPAHAAPAQAATAVAPAVAPAPRARPAAPLPAVHAAHAVPSIRSAAPHRTRPPVPRTVRHGVRPHRPHVAVPVAAPVAAPVVSHPVVPEHAAPTAKPPVQVPVPVPAAPTSTVLSTLLAPGGTVTVNLLAAVTGTRLELSTLRVADLPAHVSVAVDRERGTASLTSPAGFVGTDQFSFAVCDHAAQCVTPVVRVLVDRAPTAVADALSTPLGTTAVLDLVANDSDPDRFLDDVAGYLDRGRTVLLSTPTHGTATLTAGSLTFVPTSRGTDVLSYSVCDALGVCSTSTVTLTVT